jgi:hypothetical protein
MTYLSFALNRRTRFALHQSSGSTDGRFLRVRFEIYETEREGFLRLTIVRKLSWGLLFGRHGRRQGSSDQDGIQAAATRSALIGDCHPSLQLEGRERHHRRQIDHHIAHDLCPVDLGETQCIVAHVHGNAGAA